MGIAISTNVELTGNESLTRFIGEEQIVPNDPFWNNFLSYNISPPTSINEQLAFESKIEPFCQQLLINNLKSGNVGTLIQVFLIRASELLIATNTDDHIFSWQCFNALFAIRSILKYLTELVSEEELLQHLEFKSDNVSRVESLVSSLFGIIINVPVVDYTYLVHLEAVTCLIALLSVQTHSNKRAEQSNIFRLLMKGTNSVYAPLLVKHLLINYIAQKNAPPSFGSHNHSLVLGLASDLWSMLTFRKSTTSNLENLSQSNDSNNVPLSNNSLLLLLILANNLTTCTNPYSLSLFSCNNSQEKNPVQTEQTSFKVDYELLFSTLCTNASSDSSTLLLYLLIHKNHLFRTFILNRPDVDQLVIPILKTLYNAPNSNSHHIYMSLIILLILSEYQSFNRLIHEMKLKSITWYTERMISEVSLGGLLVLVLIRTIQYNMLKMRDKYLHTNCLAALANMSDQFRNLHPYVSQRLVSLFETLAKRLLELNKREQK